MRPTIFFAVILACGCGKKSPPAEPNVTIASGPALPASIRLPESACGKTADGPPVDLIFLHVNSKGEVIPPFDRAADTDPLTSAAALEAYLKRRAEFEKRETGKRDPEGVPVLRIDRDTPFGKVSPILGAFSKACYARYQLRVTHREHDAEASVPMSVGWTACDVIVCDGAEQPKVFAIRVYAEEAGRVTRFTFREYGSPEEGGEDLGAEVRAVRAKLAHLAEAEAKRISAAAAKGWKVPQPAFGLEPDDRLSFGTVVQLLDVGLQAGIADIRLQSVRPAP